MRRLTMIGAALGTLMTLGTAQADARAWNHHRHYGWERGHHYGWRDHHRPVYGWYHHRPRARHHHGDWR
jgi:hypothetical protein